MHDRTQHGPSTGYSKLFFGELPSDTNIIWARDLEQLSSYFFTFAIIYKYESLSQTLGQFHYYFITVRGFNFKCFFYVTPYQCFFCTVGAKEPNPEKIVTLHPYEYQTHDVPHSGNRLATAHIIPSRVRVASKIYAS